MVLGNCSSGSTFTIISEAAAFTVASFHSVIRGGISGSSAWCLSLELVGPLINPSLFESVKKKILLSVTKNKEEVSLGPHKNVHDLGFNSCRFPVTQHKVGSGI